MPLIHGDRGSSVALDDARGVKSRGEGSGWLAAPQRDLEAAIAEFKAALPGWWYSVCECQVSCDASCAPTVESPDIGLILVAGDSFDAGFHADLPQPSTLANALRNVMAQALATKALRAKLRAPQVPGESSRDTQKDGAPHV